MSNCEPDVLALTGAAAGKNSETVNLIFPLKFHDIRTVLPGTFVLFCLSEMWKGKKKKSNAKKKNRDFSIWKVLPFLQKSQLFNLFEIW